ncbi:hypothetical protein B0H17DRAFT_1137027 [Mycena rosella]|uniref:Uncharacterized protein n=1 Tax=Mycena rosella TaxID=1033263 RepID=A0AAD7D9D1_MYCRO|nr:hypothetical protein B0H17DRAFT_1137027 [Mycena rosella]
MWTARSDGVIVGVQARADKNEEETGKDMCSVRNCGRSFKMRIGSLKQLAEGSVSTREAVDLRRETHQSALNNSKPLNAEPRIDFGRRRRLGLGEALHGRGLGGHGARRIDGRRAALGAGEHEQEGRGLLELSEERRGFLDLSEEESGLVELIDERRGLPERFVRVAKNEEGGLRDIGRVLVRVLEWRRGKEGFSCLAVEERGKICLSVQEAGDAGKGG